MRAHQALPAVVQKATAPPGQADGGAAHHAPSFWLFYLLLQQSPADTMAISSHFHPEGMLKLHQYEH